MVADIAFLTLLAALPAAALLFWFYRLDRKRPEPLGLIGKSVLFGFAAVIPALVIEISLSAVAGFRERGLFAAFFSAFVVAGLVEEGVKWFFVRRFIRRRREFDEVMDGIVYTICVSLGFAFVENLLYGIGDPAVLYARAFTAVPLHAVASGIMGYHIGRAKVGAMDKPEAYEFRGFLWAVGIHGLYDFFLFAGSGTWPLALVTLVAGAVVLSRFVKSAKKLDGV